MSTDNIDKFKLDGLEIEIISSMNILGALVATDSPIALKKYYVVGQDGYEYSLLSSLVEKAKWSEHKTKGILTYLKCGAEESCVCHRQQDGPTSQS